MNIFDKIFDAYYDIKFKIEDLYYASCYKVNDIVDSVKNTSSGVVDDFEQEFIKPVKKKKTKSKKKKK